MNLRIFKKYRVINLESDFIKEQIEELKKVYKTELEAEKYFEVHNDQNYLKDFLEFDKPPIIPEQVAQTEYFRPNPAAFQRRLNDNPYAVDVGFSSLENPIYKKLDDMPSRMNPRANSEHYNPREQMNRKLDYTDPSKPFVQQLNMAVYEKAFERKQLGMMDETFLRSAIANGPQASMPFGQPATSQYPQYPNWSSAMPGNPNDQRVYDLLKDPIGVSHVPHPRTSKAGKSTHS